MPTRWHSEKILQGQELDLELSLLVQVVQTVTGAHTSMSGQVTAGDCRMSAWVHNPRPRMLYMLAVVAVCQTRTRQTYIQAAAPVCQTGERAQVGPPGVRGWAGHGLRQQQCRRRGVGGLRAHKQPP